MRDVSAWTESGLVFCNDNSRFTAIQAWQNLPVLIEGSLPDAENVGLFFDSPSA